MVSEIVELATVLAQLLAKLLDGSATPEEVQHVRDILHAKSASAQAAEDIEAARLKKLHELDDAGGDIGADEDEQTWPGTR
jgi:hypothetical protein